MCLSDVGHTANAEDLTQEVFMQVAHDVKVKYMARSDCGGTCGCGGAKKPVKAKGAWKGVMKGK